VAADKKDTSPSVAPISGARTRASEITARRGLVRDALAVIANVESMLRSKRESSFDDELGLALEGLRAAFAPAPDALRAFAGARVDSMDAAIASRDPDAIRKAANDLETAAGLLELIERAAEPGALEVSCATLAEQALQLAWSIRSQSAFGVHVRAAAADCSVTCDPHVVARMLAMAISAVHEVTPAVVVRTLVEDGAGVIEVTALSDDDAGARVMQTRLIPRIAESDALLTTAAKAAGIGLVVEQGRILLRCPRSP
jgi:hypothetical protein